MQIRGCILFLPMVLFIHKQRGQGKLAKVNKMKLEQLISVMDVQEVVFEIAANNGDGFEKVWDGYVTEDCESYLAHMKLKAL